MKQHSIKIRIILFLTASITCTALARAQQPATIKDQALQVLKSKCNNCHRIRNPGRVFNTANMDKYQPKIHQQVFIFKRMPKGRARPTEAESQALLNWVKNYEQ